MVTGANGFLGQHLLQQLQEKNIKVTATGRGPSRVMIATSPDLTYRELDIRNGNDVQEFIMRDQPEIIIHAAAMTQVDECEINKQECYNINVTATRFLISAAKEINAKLIYISTDFVFDGSRGPYREDDIPDPVNYYGSTKLAAEKAVMESGLDWAIARTVLIYGDIIEVSRKNFVTWVRQNLEAGNKIKVVTDQWRTPTFVHDLVRGIILIIEKNASGIYHLSGKEMMTPYEMAIQTARFFGLDEHLIEKTESSAFQQSGKRPSKTGFNIEKAQRELGYDPVSFKEGLKLTFIETNDGLTKP